MGAAADAIGVAAAHAMIGILRRERGSARRRADGRS
jgi:hypothetical protein